MGLLGTQFYAPFCILRAQLPWCWRAASRLWHTPALYLSVDGATLEKLFRRNHLQSCLGFLEAIRHYVHIARKTHGPNLQA